MKSFTSRILLLLFGLFFILSCGDNSTTPSGTSYAGENKVSYEAEYYDNVIIITDAQKDAYISRDTNNVYTFDAVKLSKTPVAGSIIVIPQLTARKITNVVQQGNHLVCETEPAKLTEIIKNGKISWDVLPPKLDSLNKIFINDKAVKGKLLEDGYEFNFDLDCWHYKIWLNPKGTSENGLPELQCNLIVTNTDGAGGKLTAMLGAKGTTRFPRQNGNIEIQNGKMTSFKKEDKGLRSELTFQYEAVFSRGGGTAILEFPRIAMRFPIQTLTGLPIPLPIMFDIGFSFGTEIEIPSVTAGASGEVKLILDANTGFEFKGPTLEPFYKINDNKLQDLLWNIGDNTITPAPVHLKHTLLCPRIAVEFAEIEIAWTALAYRIENSFYVPGLNKTAMAQIRMDGGYQLELMGLSLAKESYVFWSKEIEYQDK